MIPARRLGCAAIGVAVLCALPSAARSETPDGDQRKANAYLSAGLKRAEKGDYQGALKMLSRGATHVALPIFHFHAGNCHRLLGQREEAAGEYEAFLRLAPSAPEREQARQFLAALKGAGAPPAAVAAPPVAVPQPAPAVEKAPAPAPERVPREERALAPREAPKVAAVTSAPAPPPRAADDAELPPLFQPEAARKKPPVPGPAVTRADSRARTPIYKRWWLWTILVGVAAAGVGAGVGIYFATAPQDAPIPNSSQGFFPTSF